MMSEIDKYVGMIFAVAIFLLILKNQGPFNSLLGGTLTNATNFVHGLGNA
jgi:hypothetical protein